MHEQQQQHIAFMSYAHADDKHEHVSRFRERLSDEVGIQIGREFPVFQDSIHIHWGEDWKERIKQSLNESVFLIPILTPSFFNSPVCREEIELFLQREKTLKRNDLILPVYFVNCDVLNDKVKLNTDVLAQNIKRHQLADWRKFRLKSYDDQEVGSALEALALGVKEALQRTDVLFSSSKSSFSGKHDFSTYHLPANLEHLISDLVSRLDHLQAQTHSSQKLSSRFSRKSNQKPMSKSAGGIKNVKRPAATSWTTGSNYERSVFISAPFDDFYQPMFDAVVFAVTDAGFYPRSVFEAGQGTNKGRLEKIMDVIAQSQYGIVDISRTELSDGLPRFNMPLELGLFLGGLKYGAGRQKKKSLLVLDREPYRYQKFISDLSGQDVLAHANNPQTMVKIIRDWLAGSTKAIIPSGTEIYQRYKLFKKSMPSICSKLGIQPSGLSYEDYRSILAIWLKEYGTAIER